MSRKASISSSSSLSIFSPLRLTSLMPLSEKGLCEAEIITPQSMSSLRVMKDTLGVVVTCSMQASAPEAVSPAANAYSSI